MPERQPAPEPSFAAPISHRHALCAASRAHCSLPLGICSCDVPARQTAAQVSTLTAFFLLLVMLAATQDIAVDGWALTLLSERNVG